MTSYDVIVIGGGPAGLSAALTLSRARWRVLVLDDGTPRNAPAPGVHNWLTRDGLPPAEIGRLGRAEVAGYGGVVVDARVSGARALPAGVFAVATAGREDTGRRLLVTTGISDVLPDVDGLAEHWGGAVFGCPFCHAAEHGDTAIGVLSTGPHDLVKAHLAGRWSDDVTLFLHTGPEPDDRQWDGFAARGITVVDGVVTAVETRAGELAGVRLASGTTVACDALTVSPRAEARTGFLDGLGLATAAHASGLGDHLPVDAKGLTAVPGVYAACNVTDPLATVPVAVAAGATVGAAITGDLLLDDLGRSVTARRDRWWASAERELAGRVAGDRVHGLTP